MYTLNYTRYCKPFKSLRLTPYVVNYFCQQQLKAQLLTKHIWIDFVRLYMSNFYGCLKCHLRDFTSFPVTVTAEQGTNKQDTCRNNNLPNPSLDY